MRSHRAGLLEMTAVGVRRAFENRRRKQGINLWRCTTTAITGHRLALTLAALVGC